MIWFFIGVGMILGGCFCCLGCSHCTDWTEGSTVQVDIAGTAADEDAAGCCVALNRSYILTQSLTTLCTYEINYENGSCLSTECDDCDNTGCTGTCDELLNTVCNPAGDPDIYCANTGSTSYDVNCTTCADTEQATLNFPVGTNQVDRCTCTCAPTGLIWDTDIMIADHPEATWAVTGAEVYYCSCTPVDCTANNGTSSVTITVTIAKSGSDTTVTTSLGMLTRGGFGTQTVTGNPLTCATDINGLAFTVGASGSGDDIEMTDCTSTNCLCGIPTSLDVTFIP